MVHSIILVAILAGQAATAAPQASPAQPTLPVVTYDEFMIRPLGERIRVFNEVSPENRADLVRTHLTRWLERNAGRLTDEQKAVMKENLAFITADRYRDSKSPEDEALAKALDEKNAKLFSREDGRQALTIQGDYIPPTKKQ